MGVKGLTTYLNKKHYEEKIHISHTPVLIDGNNLMYHLYFHPIAKDSLLYGGDYINYAKNLKHFFLKLKLCDITPIVIFDGVYEDSKLPTVIKRFRHSIRACFKTYTPVLMKIQLLQFLKHQKIFHVQTDYEADKTLTELSSKYRIPILSNDTDFLINTDIIRINLDDIKFSNAKKEWRLTSRFVNFKKLMKEFGICDVRVIALCSFVIGNDVSDCRKLFYSDKREKRIENIFRHFGKLSYEMGVRFLIGKLGKGVMPIIRECVKGYVGLDGEEDTVKIVGEVIEKHGLIATVNIVDLNEKMWEVLREQKLDTIGESESCSSEIDSESESHKEDSDTDLDKVSVAVGKINLNDSEVKCGVKNPIVLQHRNCTHPAYLKKIQENQMIFLQPQIELLNTSSHDRSLDILKVSCSLLTSSVTVFTRSEKKLEKLLLNLESNSDRVNIYELYGVGESEVNQFPPIFKTLIMSLAYAKDWKLALGVFFSYLRGNLKSENAKDVNTVAESIDGQGKSKVMTGFYSKIDNSNSKYDVTVAFKLSEYNCILFHTIMLLKLLCIYKCPLVECIDFKFVYKFLKYFNGDINVFQGEPIYPAVIALKSIIKE